MTLRRVVLGLLRLPGILALATVALLLLALSVVRDEKRRAQRARR